MAASYTPVALLVLDGTTRWVVLGSVWGGCLAGVALSVAWVTAPRVLFALTYVALGWVIVIAFPQLRAELDLAALVLFGGRRAPVLGRRGHLRPAPAEPVAEHVRLPRDLPRPGRRRRRHPLRGDGRLGDSRGLTSISSRSPPSWSTCRVVWSIPNSSCRIRSSARRTSWQSVVAADEHVRRERREARRDLPDVQVVDLGDARVARPSAGRSPAGRARAARPPGTRGRTRAAGCRRRAASARRRTGRRCRRRARSR